MHEAALHQVSSVHKFSCSCQHLPHRRARCLPTGPNTNGSQFFICTVMVSAGLQLLASIKPPLSSLHMLEWACLILHALPFLLSCLSQTPWLGKGMAFEWRRLRMHKGSDHM